MKYSTSLSSRRLKGVALASTALLLILTPNFSSARSFSVGNVCRGLNIKRCGSCEGGEFIEVKGSDDSFLCAPKFKQCQESPVDSQEEDTSCGCCSDMNGKLSQQQCLPDHLCSTQKVEIGAACDHDSQCESMNCESWICQEPNTLVVKRMLQNDPDPTITPIQASNETTTTSSENSTTPTTPTTPPTTPTTPSTDDTSNNTTSTNTSSPTTPPENLTAAVIDDPVERQNYSCFICAELGHGFDAKGCFNKTIQPSRLAKSATTSDGCFSQGQWVKGNNDLITIEDLSKNSSSVFTFTKTCNRTGEEYYLLLTNNLAQSNEVNATLLPDDNTTVQESLVDTYCSGRNGDKCSLNNTQRKGFNQYVTRYGDKLEFWLYCNANDVTLNSTLTVTARFLNVIDIEEESSGVSGGGIAGIVIACIVVFLFGLGMLIKVKGVTWIVNTMKCCKNKTQNLPDESPRNPHDIDRRETGLAGNQADGQAHNPVNIQPNSSGKDDRHPNGPLIDPDLMSATSAPFQGQDLNSTGQHLLSQLKHGTSDYNTAANDRNIGSAPNTGMPTSPSAQGGLPNIHIDKKGAAQGWKNALDSDRRGDAVDDDEMGKTTDLKSSKRELTKDHSEGKE